MHKTARSLLFPLIVICSTFVAGCGSSVPVLKPFKMDIQQGNVVTSKMLLQLRPGMTKSQVKFIMGTPLVIDSFHTNRWDYFYQLRQAGKVVEQRRVILDFEQDLLARVRGDVVPQGTAGADTGAVVLTKEPAAVTKPAEKEGVLESLKFWKNREVPESGGSAGVKSTAEPVAPELISTPKAVSPSEAVKHQSTPGVAESASQPAAAETPSMLAVPISITPVEDASVVEHQSVKTKPVGVPAVVTTPDLPTKSDSAVKLDDERALKLDRNLDAKNTESNNAVQTTTKNISKPAEKPNSVVDKSPPVEEEEEPGYFERMLEKIGF